jgi:NADPH:quinone reductase-like Zn-dependent oxidoreductase
MLSVAFACRPVGVVSLRARRLGSGLSKSSVCWLIVLVNSLVMQQKPISGADDRTPPERRSQGQMVVARSLWYVKPGVAELRPERLAPPNPGEARVATLYSAISRGSERLVAYGEVPESEWTNMRAPLQSGAFPYPVKYGYSATGIVSGGSSAFRGRTVFCLHPHQDHFQVPEDMLTLVPDDIPAKRATLAANMETALNAHWDAGTRPCDRVLVVGAGIVGLLVAHLASRIAGIDVAITDIDTGRASMAQTLGVRFITPNSIAQDYRIVFHTSASASGLETAINAAAFEGKIIELSWYGSRSATVRLGAAFHSRRLQIISSQVGHVALTMRAAVSQKARIAKAVALLDDPRLDALVADEIAFDDVPEMLPQIFSNSSNTLCPVIRYSNA